MTRQSVLITTRYRLGPTGLERVGAVRPGAWTFDADRMRVEVRAPL